MAITATFTLDDQTVEGMNKLVGTQKEIGNQDFNKSLLIRLMVETFTKIQKGELNISTPKVELPQGKYIFTNQGFSGFMFNLVKDGYSPHPPTPSAGEMDKEICETSDCPECSHKGLIYRPFTKDESYRAFAVCPDCNWFQEF